MRLLKFMFLGLLVVAMMAARQIDRVPACDVKVEYEWTSAKDGVESKLVIKATGGKSPYTYLLLDNKGMPKSMDFSKQEFSGLATGEYKCIVLDKNECRTEISVVLK